MKGEALLQRLQRLQILGHPERFATHFGTMIFGAHVLPHVSQFLLSSVFCGNAKIHLPEDPRATRALVFCLPPYCMFFAREMCERNDAVNLAKHVVPHQEHAM